MCGLCGVASNNILDKHRQAFTQMFHVSALRGIDASGLATFRTNYNGSDPALRVAKFNFPSFDLIRTKKYREMLDQVHNKVLMGHTRSGTVGDNNEANAHPFLVKHICGMHNGTLRGFYPNRKDNRTDSEALYTTLAEKGIKDTILELDGAWALTWINIHDSTLHLLRNSERELWIANDEATQAIFWASEKRILEFALSRVGIVPNRIVKMATDTDFSFNLLAKESIPRSIKASSDIKQKEVKSISQGPFRGANIGAIFDPDDETPWTMATWEEALKRKTEEENEALLASLEPRPVFVQPPDSARSAKSTSTALVSVESTPTRTTSPIQFNRRLNAADRHGRRFSKRHGKNLTYRGYNGVELTDDEFRKILSDGCAWCGHSPSMGTPLRWLNYDQFLCEKCKNAPCFAFEDKDPKPKAQLS